MKILVGAEFTALYGDFHAKEAETPIMTRGRCEPPQFNAWRERKKRGSAPALPAIPRRGARMAQNPGPDLTKGRRLIPLRS